MNDRWEWTIRVCCSGDQKPMTWSQVSSSTLCKNLEGQGIPHNLQDGAPGAPWTTAPPRAPAWLWGRRNVTKSSSARQTYFRKLHENIEKGKKEEERSLSHLDRHRASPSPTAVILKLGHKIIWSSSHQEVEAACFPWVWAGSDTMWLMKLGQEMLCSFGLEYLGSLLRLPPLGIQPLSSEKPKPQSYRERPHEGVLQGTGPALSPTFKTQHKSQSAGAAQGWARARQGRHLPVLQNWREGPKPSNQERYFWMQLKNECKGLPWLPSGWESASQCRGRGVDPWSAN